ncbi:MAG: alpha/beta fold hydrolase [Acetobacteraceae bacterium]
MEMRSSETRFLLNGRFYRMAAVEMGDPAASPVICVHGLTRSGRDFDPLMSALAERFLVIAPDLPGRGRSDWLADGALYQPVSYVQALAHLLAKIGRPVMWVGTSLGGICGMMIAAARGQPITRMVLNDIGPEIPEAALKRIRDYMLAAPEGFADLAALESHLRLIYAPFGSLSDADWARMALTSARPLPDGRLAFHYDPRIADPIRAEPPAAINMWALWERIRIPVLVIRGQSSDLLLPETLQRMTCSGARSLVVAGAGHAPALADRASQQAIADFLSG